MTKKILNFDMMHQRQNIMLSIRKTPMSKITLGGLGE